jgi:hypothetical protein
MTIEVQDYDELTTAAVTQAREFIAQLTQESNPSIDTRRGPIFDLVIHPSALHRAARQEEIDRYRRSSTLAGITEDPTLADDDEVDAVMSNYRITRKSGATASGNVTIIVSELSSLTIANGASFEASGKTYTTLAAYAIRISEENVLGSTDRVLSPTSDGNYSFSIPVTATETGVSSMVNKDTAFVPTNSVLNLVRAFASEDFLGGRDEQTNAELIAEQEAGIAASAASNRINMLSAIRDVTAFQDIVSSSIIGYGDMEMLRDQHSIFPHSFGGRADWYVRTQQLPQKLAVSKTATLIEKTSDGKGIWQFSIGREDAPGMYDVLAIVPAGETDTTGTYAITRELRSYDLTAIGGELTPDIVSSAEAMYSRYQTVVVQFKDTDTDTAALILNTSTLSYDVTVRAMPLIDDIQTHFGSREQRNYGGDILIKAPIPCFMSLSFTLSGKSGEALPNAELIRDDIATFVNQTGFCGRIFAASIADIVHNHITNKTLVSNIDMVGNILKPDGTTQLLRHHDELTIPDDQANMLSARTANFILDPEDIQISGRTINIPELG